MTDWGTEDKDGAGQCRYLVERAGNSTGCCARICMCVGGYVCGGVGAGVCVCVCVCVCARACITGLTSCTSTPPATSFLAWFLVNYAWYILTYIFIYEFN